MANVEQQDDSQQRSSQSHDQNAPNSSPNVPSDGQQNTRQRSLLVLGSTQDLVQDTRERTRSIALEPIATDPVHDYAAYEREQGQHDQDIQQADILLGIGSNPLPTLISDAISPRHDAELASMLCPQHTGILQSLIPTQLFYSDQDPMQRFHAESLSRLERFLNEEELASFMKCGRCALLREAMEL